MLTKKVKTFLTNLYEKDPDTQISMMNDYLDFLMPEYDGSVRFEDREWTDYDALDRLFKQIDVKKVCQTALVNIMHRTYDISACLANRDTYYYKLYEILPYELYLKL